MPYRTAKRTDDHVLQDILALVDCRVTLKEIRSWSPGRKAKIEAWASKSYLRASDNNCRVPDKPRFKSKPITYPKSMGDLYAK